MGLYKKENFTIEWDFKTPKEIIVDILGQHEKQVFYLIEEKELKELIYNYIENKDYHLFSDCESDEASTIMYLVVNDKDYHVTDSIDSLITALHEKSNIYLINIEDNLL